MPIQEGKELTHGNTVPGRVDTTSGWTGPDPTLNAGRTLSGDEFNKLRADAEAARQAGTVQPDQPLAVQLANSGLPKQAAQIIANKLDELAVQLSLLRNLPPRMAKAERRG
jgi:hypothetical protein